MADDGDVWGATQHALAGCAEAPAVAAAISGVLDRLPADGAEFASRDAAGAVKDVVRRRLAEDGDDALGGVIAVVEGTLQVVTSRPDPPVPAALPLEVLEEALQACTVTAIPRLWAVLERHQDTLMTPQFVPSKGNPATKLALLRAANGALARLSTVADAELCGRILLFLAYVLPLSERSGVNVAGKFNTENVTHYDGGGDGAAPVASGVDPAAYTAFWRLQAYTLDPGLAVGTTDGWRQFLADADAVFSGFEAQRATQERGGGAAESSVKYLTSSTLFQLQLSDRRMRQHTLTQLLILCDHLLHLPASRVAARGVSVVDTVPRLAGRALQLLAASGGSGGGGSGGGGNGGGGSAGAGADGDGDTLTRTVVRALASERAWRDWKAASCPPLERPLTDTTKAMVQEVLTSALAGTDVPGADPLGPGFRPAPARPPPRDRQWVASTVASSAIEACAASGRPLRPQFAEYLEDLRMALDPKGMFYDPHSTIHEDVAFQWRGLRLCAAEGVDTVGQKFVRVACGVLGVPVPGEAEAEAEVEAAGAGGGGRRGRGSGGDGDGGEAGADKGGGAANDNAAGGGEDEDEEDEDEEEGEDDEGEEGEVDEEGADADTDNDVEGEGGSRPQGRRDKRRNRRGNRRSPGSRKTARADGD